MDETVAIGDYVTRVVGVDSATHDQYNAREHHLGFARSRFAELDLLTLPLDGVRGYNSRKHCLLFVTDTNESELITLTVTKEMVAYIKALTDKSMRTPKIILSDLHSSEPLEVLAWMEDAKFIVFETMDHLWSDAGDLKIKAEIQQVHEVHDYPCWFMGDALAAAFVSDTSFQASIEIVSQHGSMTFYVPSEYSVYDWPGERTEETKKKHNEALIRLRSEWDRNVRYAWIGQAEDNDNRIRITFVDKKDDLPCEPCPGPHLIQIIDTEDGKYQCLGWMQDDGRTQGIFTINDSFEPLLALRSNGLHSHGWRHLTIDIVDERDE